MQLAHRQSTLARHIDGQTPMGYTQVAEEHISATVTRSYTYGLQRISIHDANGIHFYGYDAHSGVRELTDGSGVVTDMWNYDAFGNVVGRVGGTDNSFTYRGEQLDATLGLTYLRARWLDPARGRYRTMDTWEGLASSPMSLNTFQYVLADPINAFDPTGHLTLLEIGIAGAITGTLSGIHAGLAGATRGQIAVAAVEGFALGAGAAYVISGTAALGAVRVLAGFTGQELAAIMTAVALSVTITSSASEVINPRLNTGQRAFAAVTGLIAVGTVFALDSAFFPPTNLRPGPTPAAGLPPGTLTAEEARALQAIADRFNTTLDVIGSRAAGLGRNIDDPTLPVELSPGVKGPRSDIDLRIDGEVVIKSGGRFADALKEVGGGAGSIASELGPSYSQAPYIRFTPGGGGPMF